jgi:hypothetical protein
MFDVTILQTQEEMVPNERGVFVPHVRVTFKVGDDGPFTRKYPLDGFNASAVKQALDAFARELRQLHG